MTREPNTQYVLSLSYGKDSLACLEAIRILGLPLDRIVHAEVWATDTIPADLPPMVEFKKKADEIILKRYGIVVEHICAVERERDHSRSRDSSTLSDGTRKSEENVSTDSQWSEALGVTPNSNSQPSNELRKLTFEKLFYHIPKRRGGERERERERERRFNRGIPKSMALALQQTQIPNDTGFDTDSRDERCLSANLDSKPTSSIDIYGFPYTGMRNGGMGWCHRLKYTPFLLAPLSRGQR